MRLRGLLVTALLWACAEAQQQTGELRIEVTDPTGAALRASGEIRGDAVHVAQKFTTNAAGRWTIQPLPLGVYRLTIERPGFEPYSGTVEIRSNLPVERHITLGIAAVETTVQVRAPDTLLNPDQTGAVQDIGGTQLNTRATSTAGRDVINLVDQQPGWLLEANGVLHPRGFEYGVQYVVDGVPMFENRSPVFAPAFDVEEFQSIAVRTGGYPAEYGHQLGGVIEITTERPTRPGLQGKATLEGGSFDSLSAALSMQYVLGRNVFGATGDGFLTNRYLDPPVQQNYTNHGSGADVSAQWERDWNDRNRTRILFQHNQTGFLVPNELVQQQAGQRQDRDAGETSGQISYMHLFSPSVLFDLRGSARDVTAGLWSNPESIPIAPAQERGFRQAYTSGAVSVHAGRHDIKFGAEALFRSIHENFRYVITAYDIAGSQIFDAETPASFAFSDRRQDREQAAFIQDQIRFGSLTVNAGVRWDHYSLLVNEHAASPRLAAAWQVPHAGLVLRASYDRIFQTPAIENLLLASSAAALGLNQSGIALPVRPGRGNFWEAGFTKALASHVRLEASYFRRDMRNFADDNLLLNTGISFPIAFASAQISGEEVKVDVPRWGPVSGFIAYTNMQARGRLPVTGGLFLEDGAAALLASTDTFPVTQDQRNTVRAQFRYELTPRVWFGAGAEYGSGLPVEIDPDTNISSLVEQYGQHIVDQVNFARGRTRPNFSLDLSAGAQIWKREKRGARIQADIFNVTNRLNVIDFAGLFSGTAIGAPRWAAVRLTVDF